MLTKTALAFLSVQAALLMTFGTGITTLTPRHYVCFSISLTLLQALLLVPASTYRRKQGGAGLALKLALIGESSLITALAHKLLVSPFLEAPLRINSLMAWYLCLAAASMGALTIREHLDPQVAGKIRGQRPLDAVISIVRCYFTWLTVCVVLAAVAAKTTGLQARYRVLIQRLLSGFPATRPATIQWTLEPLVPSMAFDQPIAVFPDPEIPRVVYVLERKGTIQRIDLRQESPVKQQVLDIRDRVGSVNEERGAFAAAFHPDLSWSDLSQPYLFVWHTASSGSNLSDRLSRFTASSYAQPFDPQSEFILIDQPDRNGLHNGGSLAFGPDGFLYLSLGDEGAGECCDPFGNSQRITQNLFSGILRIDVDRRGAPISHPIVNQPVAGRTQGYFIPSDNPFVGLQRMRGGTQKGVLEEFWAVGLRNPWGMHFDSADDQLWVADVGGGDYEEINRVRKGSNFQWSFMEGPRRVSKTPEDLLGSETPPVFAYQHEWFRLCIIGGVVYRGERHGELHGKYIYADYGSGEIFSLKVEDGMAVSNEILTPARIGLRICAVTQIDQEILVASLGQHQVFRLVRAQPADTQPVLANDTPTATEIYQALCVRCHGADGTPTEQPSVASEMRARNFADETWQASVTDQEIARTIRDGPRVTQGISYMPAWGAILRQEQIRDLVRLIRQFGES